MGYPRSKHQRGKPRNFLETWNPKTDNPKKHGNLQFSDPQTKIGKPPKHKIGKWGLSFGVAPCTKTKLYGFATDQARKVRTSGLLAYWTSEFVPERGYPLRVGLQRRAKTEANHFEDPLFLDRPVLLSISERTENAKQLPRKETLSSIWSKTFGVFPLKVTDPL